MVNIHDFVSTHTMPTHAKQNTLEPSLSVNAKVIKDVAIYHSIALTLVRALVMLTEPRGAHASDSR